jgi:hypothetical protein
MASDEWISGFVGAQLAHLGDAKAKTAAIRAFQVLQDRRRGQPGWGYCAHTPPDADSTAWVLVLARALGRDDDASLSPHKRFLASHHSDETGVQTYNANTLARLGTALPKTDAHRLWYSAQAEIMASVALAGLDSAAADLPGLQRADGSWSGFWMKGDAYATGLSLIALSGTTNNHVIRLGVNWCVSQLSVPKCPFDLAWLLHGISTDPDPSRHLDALRGVWPELLSYQNKDGSWPSSCVMHVPLPGERADEVTQGAFTDQARVFTTAAVVSAMEKVAPLINAGGAP